MFKEGQLADFPEKHVELTVNDEGQIYLAGLLKDLGLSASAGQARRDIDGGGVKINGKAVAPKSYNIDPSALKLGDPLSVGKRKGLGTFLLCRHFGTLLVIGAKQPLLIAPSGVCR